VLGVGPTDLWDSSGILIFETDSAMVQDNVVNNSQSGIEAETWCCLAPSSSQSQFVKKEVLGSAWGIAVDAIAWAVGTGNPIANNNKAVNNLVTGALGGHSGGTVGGLDSVTTFATEVKNNKVINNIITGSLWPVDHTGTKTKVHAVKPIEH